MHGPLMWLDSEEIVEASLLSTTNGRPITPPAMQEEAVLLGDEQEPQEALEVTVTTSSSECPEVAEPERLTKWADAPSPPTLCPWPQTPRVTTPRTQGEPNTGLD